MRLLKRLINTFLENDIIFIIFFALVFFGVAFQYSAAKSMEPWALSHAVKACLFLPILFFMQFVKPNTLIRYSYLIYIINILLLIVVNIFGFTGMGAQRWINLGIIKLQPSEMMKISIILMLAKYYNDISPEYLPKLYTHFVPLIGIAIPCFLIAIQPDLGTAVIVGLIGLFCIFISGINLRYVLLSAIGVVSSFPYVWSKLYDYQKKRILTFLNPESDPLGSGYHVIQSKIAIGSSGMYGKGFFNGTQSRLNFLPEKHTDFIFATLSEETGFVGSIFIIALFAMLIYYIVKISLSSNNSFYTIVGLNIAFLFFVHVFVNMGMVIGLLPVVGVPLPLISYGGSSLLTFSILIGIVIGISMNNKKSN